MKKLLTYLLVFSGVVVAITFRPDSLTKLDIEIITPSSGRKDKSLWKKVFKITGAKCDALTTSSTEQCFADQDKKFKKLDKSLKSSHKIIWTFCGGYEVDKLMGKLAASDYSKTSRKIIIGFSDATPLLIYMSQKYNWTAIHAPDLTNMAQKNKSPESYDSLIKFLHGKTNVFKISDLIPLNERAKTLDNVVIQGIITGGNLTCIESTIGTPWQIETQGKIILLEDIGIKDYYLDRLLTHLDNAGLFNCVAAIIFGDFGANATALKILENFASKMSIPVYKSESFGHGRNNLPFGYNFLGKITKRQKTSEITMTQTEQ
jgi:muramoyltetrapeptide carboxypeptidase